MTPVPQKSVVADERLQQYNRFSVEDFVAFWKYAFKKRRIGLFLYPAVCLTILLGYYQLVQYYTGNVLSVDALVVSVLTVGLFALFFIYLPSMPGEYQYRFNGKLREDLGPGEIKQLLMDLLAKSLEQASVIVTALLAACVAIYPAAKGLMLPDFWAWVIVGGTGINIYLLSLVIVSLGRYNRAHLGKIFVDDEYRRYTSFDNYKKLLTILGVVDLLGIIALVVTQLSGL